MKIKFEHNGLSYTADLSHPLDLSIPLRAGLENPNCYWAPTVEIWPVVAGVMPGCWLPWGIKLRRSIVMQARWPSRPARTCARCVRLI